MISEPFSLCACGAWLQPTSPSVCSAAPHQRWHREPLGASGSSCDQRLVSQALARNTVNEAVEPLQRVTGHVAVVEPERELVNVAAKMLRAGVVVDADQAALED